MLTLSSPFFSEHRFPLNSKLDDACIMLWSEIALAYGKFIAETPRTERIPKLVHHIWMGSNLPQRYQDLRAKWIELNPGYRFILWDESMILSLGLHNERAFVNANSYGVKSDIARYEILHRYGGIYVDTDFEAIRPIPKRLLSFDIVVGQLANARPQFNNALIMASKGASVMLQLIHGIGSIPSSPTPEQVLGLTGPEYLTRMLCARDLLNEEILVLPSQYFYPWPSYLIDSPDPPLSYCSDSSVALHHWHMSWFIAPTAKGFRYWLRRLLRAFVNVDGAMQLGCQIPRTALDFISSAWKSLSSMGQRL